MQTTTTRQAQRSRSTRDQIIQAALTIFALKGYASASMDDVCLAAGCSKGGLYHHFRTKAHILSGVIDRLASEGALLPPFQASAGKLGLSPNAFGRVLMEIWVECARNPELRDQLRAAYEATFDARITNGTQQPALTEILRIGALVQLLSRGEALDAGDAARRLGISRAA